MPTIAADQVQAIAASALRNAGATDQEVQVVASHLVAANLAGHDSHGVMRIIQYAEMIRTGQIIPGARPRIEQDTPVAVSLDASHVFGHVVAADAMQQAINKARNSSVGIVTVNKSPHNGRLGTFGEMAAAENMVGLLFLSAGGGGRFVAPFGGLGRRLSTNPMAMGAPSGGEFPILLDISTCIVPEGKVRHYHQSGKPVPEGWIMDSDGNLTTDPGKLYESIGACLQPLGGNLAGHKGYGLSFMVEVLAGALSGGGCARDLPDDHEVGHCLLMLAIDVAQFTTLELFTSQVSTMVDYIKTCPPAPGFREVLVPGEFEYRNRQERLAQGIAIPDPVWKDLEALAAER